MKSTGRKPALLCVDDEENILAALRRVFADEGFEVICASSGRDGLGILEREPVGVVLSDQRMPGMSGTEFLRAARVRAPSAQRIILSGFAELSVVVAAINDGEINKFISKPWNDDALRETVRECFRQFEAQVAMAVASEEIREENDSLRAFNADLELRNRALDLYQDLFDQMPVGLLGVGSDGTIALANAVSRNLLSQGEPPPLGAHFRDVLPDALAHEVMESIDGDEPRRVRFGHVTPDLTVVDARIQPLAPSARERGVIVVLYAVEELAAS